MSRRKKTQNKFICFLLCCICVITMMVILTFRNKLKDSTFLEINKCPACYGISYCKHLLQGKVKLEGWQQINQLHFFNVKNVFFANHEGTKLVLKKLGHSKELLTLDRRICESAKLEKHCDVQSSLYKTKFMKAVGKDRGIVANFLPDLTETMTCPSQRLINRMFARFNEKIFIKKSVTDEKLMMITTLMINPEPLILQAFPSREGWPFPAYYGACGRYVVEEYGGKPLADFYHSDWYTRVGIAYQLLQQAEKFTNNDLNFSLYWTDLSYDNIAINHQGEVVIIDAEHIIIVDKKQIEKESMPGYGEPLISQFDTCKTKYDNCLGFSPSDLCSRLTSDHNYYALCRNLLSSYASEEGRPDGLLHDMPDTIKQTYQLDTLLDECAKPSNTNGRFEVKNKLLDIMSKIVTKNKRMKRNN